MEVKMTARKFRLTQAIKNYVEKKLQRIEKYAPYILGIQFIMDKERENFIIEAIIKFQKKEIVCQESSPDTVYAAIDLLFDVIERKLKKENEKAKDRRTRKQKRVVVFSGGGEGVRAEKNERPRLIRESADSLKPLFPEDALEELKNSDKDFLTFINASTERLSVVYRRPDGHFGLIE